MQQQQSVVIIGAGIAGLSAGIYLQRAGFKTEIYEMGSQPGGQCTSWKRGRFTFDGCIHWLAGVSPKDNLYSLWSDLGALKGIEIHREEIYLRVQSGKQEIIFWGNIDRLKEELLGKAPEDKKEIKKLIRAIRKAGKIDIRMGGNPMEEKKNSFGSSLKFFFSSLLPMVPLFPWMNISAEKYANKFRNPLLYEAITYLFTPQSSMFFNIVALAWMHNGNVGYPIGGSLAFIQNIEQHYRELGGQIHYGRQATKAEIENGHVHSIQFADGSPAQADHFISTADAHFSMEVLLEGKYPHKELERAFQKLPLFTPILMISLGLSNKISGFHSMNGLHVKFDEPVVTPQISMERCLVHSLTFDPTLAPKDKEVMAIIVETDYDTWNTLYAKSKKEYNAAKAEIADALIRQLDKSVLPGLAKAVEKTDIASPVTWTHYTGIYRGAFEGFQPSPEGFRMSGALKQHPTPAGLDNFYLAGQWLIPGGGLPAAAISGRDAAGAIVRMSK